MDYAGPYLGRQFLVVVNAHSKWCEVFPMHSTTSAVTVETLRALFAQFGLPEVLVSDNRPNFVSAVKIFKDRNTPSRIVVGRCLWSSLDLLKPDLASRMSEKQMLQKAGHDKHAWEKKI